MNQNSFKTSHLNSETTQKEWYVVDASSQVLGRLATKIAMVIRGKHKPTYSPHVDGGDYVVVINAEKVRLTGKKMTDKEYISHTGYPGGQRFATPREWMNKFPNRVVEHAVRGMLPKSRLGRRLFTHLYVYAGPNHPHQAQNPKELKG